jgi:hypothetical protein
VNIMNEEFSSVSTKGFIGGGTMVQCLTHTTAPVSQCSSAVPQLQLKLEIKRNTKSTLSTNRSQRLTTLTVKFATKQFSC